VLDALLRIENVSKNFGGLRAVDNVTLSVRKKSIIGLIGPNGSGKTTLFNLVSGFYRPDSGTIYFDGSRIDGKSLHEVYAKGLVRTFQIPRLFWGLTVLDNLLLAARGHVGDGLVNTFVKYRDWRQKEVEIAEKALKILEIIHLDQARDFPASDLSGGQMKLLEVGMVLMSEPKMMLLDEPVAGVNPVLASAILDRIQAIRSELGISFFIIEHKIEVLVKHAEWIYVMNKGRLVAQGKPDEIVNNKTVIDVYLGEA